MDRSKKLITKYLKDLGLPVGWKNLYYNLYKLLTFYDKKNNKFDMKNFENQDIEVLVVIIVLLKLIYGLDDENYLVYN